MKFNTLDTESTYRRLLAEDSAEERERIFCTELVEPFQGLINRMGGGDGLAMFKQWGMSPEQFSEDNREHMRGVIDALAEADAWNRAEKSLDEGYAAFAPYADRIATQEITFGLLVAKLGSGTDDMGYTGFGGIPGWIMTVYGTPNAHNLARVEACTVHELHHNLSAVISGAAMNAWKDFMNVTVADYMLAEGQAESFAAEFYGEEMTGPWVSDFDESRLEETKVIFKEGLKRTGFNTIRGYIFGGEIAEEYGLDAVNVPKYAGYALGYRVMQAYLKKTGKSVVEATLIPTDEIIAVSGYFE